MGNQSGIINRFILIALSVDRLFYELEYIKMLI